MLYKVIAAAFLLSSAEALKINAAGMTRRAAIGAAVPVAMAPLAALALERAEDAAIYARADKGQLNAARAIERAKQGDLVNGSSATCDELDKLIAVDREAIEFEKEKITAGAADSKKVQGVEDKLQDQVNKLKKIRKDKGCASAQVNLKKATDFDIYKRADEGTLTSARVIERAKRGELVDGSSATCAQLDALINTDKKAVLFEKQKLEAMGSKADPADLKIVQEAEAAIEKQVKKLEGLKKSKKC